MNENNVETNVEITRALARVGRKREQIIESIIYGLRNDGPTTEPASALKDRVGDLARLVEFDATIQGIIQGYISSRADLAGETDSCEALFSEYQLA